MSAIKEMLAKIDMADGEHSPSKRAEWSDALIGEIREIFSDDRLSEICTAEKDGRLAVLPCKEKSGD